MDREWGSSPHIAYRFHNHDYSESIIISAVTGEVLSNEISKEHAGIASLHTNQHQRALFAGKRQIKRSGLRTGCSLIASDIRVFPSHPDNGSHELRHANVCYDSTPILEGHFANVYVDGRSKISGDFTDILPGNTGWSEISVFWHLSQASQFFHESGFIDDVSTDDSHIQVIDGRLLANDASPLASVDVVSIPIRINVAEDVDPVNGPYYPAYYEAAVIAHEVGHVMHTRFSSVPTCSDMAFEQCGISEGIADYLGILYRNFSEGTVNAPWSDPVIGDYMVETPSDPSVADLPRDLTHSGPDYCDYGVESEIWSGNQSEQSVYDVAMILSTALMDFDAAHGGSSYAYVIAALRGLQETRPTYSDFRDELVDATRATVVSYNPIYTSSSPTYLSCSSCDDDAEAALDGRNIGQGQCIIPKRGKSTDPGTPQKQNIEQSLLVYPNPSVGRFKVLAERFVGDVSRNSVRMYDILGRDVSAMIRIENFAEGSLDIITKNLAPGSYILVIQDDERSSSLPVHIIR